jgi:tripartite-type tricarboxylate transporter receptor subunit TctC
MLTRILLSAVLVLGTSVGTAMSQPASGANYPSQPIRFVIPFPAGGGVDATSRIVAEKLQQRWGQPVIVENRTGAGGNVGADNVAASAPDGYSLLYTAAGPLTINSVLYKKLSYDPTAFEPVVRIGFSPMVLAVRKDFPAKSVAELVAYGKANPGKTNFASQGNATTAHLSLELLQQLTGAKFTHVPYRGTAPAMADLVAGHVDALFGEIATLLPLHAEGRIRIIASAADRRLPSIADIPTLQEAGYPKFRAEASFLLAAPAKTPVAVISKLNEAINDVLKMPDVQAKLAAIQVIITGGTPATMKQYVDEETTRWTEVIRQADVKLE